VQSGELKVLAVTGKDRFPALPNVPAAAESGVVPGYDVTTWYGMIAPRGLPAPVLDRLNKVLNETIADPIIRERLTKAGVLARGSSVEKFGTHIAGEYARWNKVREAAGIAQQ
jgi:tripartite-type tricarboxylate transporter receptor subunit TctC